MPHTERLGHACIDIIMRPSKDLQSDQGIHLGQISQHGVQALLAAPHDSYARPILAECKRCSPADASRAACHLVENP